MGSANVESDLRAALASAPLSDAALGDVITNVLSIITDAIEPGGSPCMLSRGFSPVGIKSIVYRVITILRIAVRRT